MTTKNKVLATTGILLASTIVLTACSSGKDKKEGKESSSTYSYVFTSDPNTFDYTFSAKSSNGDHFKNFVDGLMEFDQYGNVVPSLAKDWSVSKDGLTYTYKLRKDIPWVDSQGNEVAKVTAQDFVTGLKHAVKAKSETLYIVQNSIKGLDDYVNGKISDFNQVGVKAVDENTVQYTLNKPESYWNSKTTYGVLFPVNEEFLKEKGDKFGEVTPDGILYNGPYVLSNFTSKSVMEYVKNDSYWDKDHVYLDEVKFTYSDGSDPDSYYKGFDEGKYSEARVYPNNPAYKDVQAKYKDNIVWSMPDRSTYNMTFNFNRGTYNATSKKTDKEKQDTQKAIRNKEFRQAIQFALDKKAYQAQSAGEEGALNAVRNTFVPGDFVSIEGKPFSEETQKLLREQDPEAFGDVNLKDSQNAYYNQDKAKEFMAKAKEALQKENIQFPIHLDLPQVETNEVLVNAVKSFKKSMEDTLGKDNVIVDIQLLNSDAYNTATYLASTGAQGDFDISAASGWSADYQDPKSFLNVYESQTGDQLHTLGLESKGNYKNGVDPSKEAKEAIKLSEYDKLLAQADAITDDLEARYKAYAKAEAWLLDNVIQIPINAAGGTPAVTKVQPFTKPYGMSGSTAKLFKGMKVVDHSLTTKEYETAKKDWQEKREETAKKYAKETEQKIKEAK